MTLDDGMTHFVTVILNESFKKVKSGNGDYFFRRIHRIAVTIRLRRMQVVRGK